MNSLKILLSASLLALSAVPSLADGPGGQSGDGSNILNTQINLQNNWSNLNVTVDTVGANVVGQGAAAGNLIDITTMNNTRVTNSQTVGPGATIGSNINMQVSNVWGSVAIQNQVVCNSASISTDPVLTSVNSNQECHAADPFSGIGTSLRNIAGDAVVQSSALGNSFEADSNAPNFPITTRQLNNSANVSSVNASAINVGGSVGFSSSAIGNTSQIIHYNAH
ncbi:MAG TPA: hypothetical protein VJP60_03870 [Rhizomicrobium sp.]|nr:hypothetical protein [Rhizomicrobium sp.]